MSLRLLQPHRGAQTDLSALAAPPDFQFRRNAPARGGGAFPSAGQKPGLPRIEPGQLWLVEVGSERRLSAAERHLIKSANVVVYDRSLASGVAEILPLGGYAEPAPSGDAGAAAIDRCARFARDGWAVVRLIDGILARADRQKWLQAVSARLGAGGAAASPRIFIDGECSADAAADSTLCDIDIRGDIPHGESLIVVFAATVPETAQPILAVAGNGLAG